MYRVISTFYHNRTKVKFHFSDISAAKFDEIPDKTKGVYVLAAKKTSFLYPSKKKSKVFYIGMSVDLKKRLKTHLRHIIDAGDLSKKERGGYSWCERYQYAASFGCEVFVFRCIGSQKPKDLENDLIDSFYKKFLGKPVANGAFSFKKGFSKHKSR